MIDRDGNVHHEFPKALQKAMEELVDAFLYLGPRILNHPWPGNVRELENTISTACITATGDFIDINDLPDHLQQRPLHSPGDADWRPLALDEIRKQHLQKVLKMCNGNRSRAAQILGIGRTSMYRYMKRDGFDGHLDPSNDNR